MSKYFLWQMKLYSVSQTVARNSEICFLVLLQPLMPLKVIPTGVFSFFKKKQEPPDAIIKKQWGPRLLSTDFPCDLIIFMVQRLTLWLPADSHKQIFNLLE